MLRSTQKDCRSYTLPCVKCSRFVNDTDQLRSGLVRGATSSTICFHHHASLMRVRISAGVVSNVAPKYLFSSDLRSWLRGFRLTAVNVIIILVQFNIMGYFVWSHGLLWFTVLIWKIQGEWILMQGTVNKNVPHFTKNSWIFHSL